MRLLFLGFLMISACVVYSSNHQADIFILEDSSLLIEMNSNSFQNYDNIVYQPKHRKLKAVLLAVFLGHFGVHRIYLGTSPNVPVVYSLTLGGGLGLLPLIDIYSILKSKDLNEFKDSHQVFMWTTPQ